MAWNRARGGDLTRKSDGPDGAERCCSTVQRIQPSAMATPAREINSLQKIDSRDIAHGLSRRVRHREQEHVSALVVPELYRGCRGSASQYRRLRAALGYGP